MVKRKTQGFGCLLFVGIVVAAFVPAVRNAQNAARRTNDK